MARITKDKLLQLQRVFKTDEAIGKKFGITRQAVFQLRKNYDIESLREINPKRDKEMRKLYNAGTSVAVLVKKYNLSSSQVYRIVNR